ncbi:regulatory protein, luxR family [Friedmanniella luteola]|uniref:Regulatory protein, luxR family n=1 Tax=Friedmanniella luteola TaxID=546871 RepID=A0A1H1PH46_9ACTN|nr:LuxR C-terminal-related transcriptional regulator [Friedmanniella luteola]SDS10608.1 regulatory protein, luxR family [Friedmanniella luteola]
MTGLTADVAAGVGQVGLRLAVALADVPTLRTATGTTLPVLAAVTGAPVVVFAVAGTRAAGARCWPEAPDWSAAFEAELAAVWESGPLTTYCRRVGVVPPFRVDDLVRELGWESLPLRAPGGELLRFAAYLAVAVLGETVCGYVVGRVDRPVDDDELDGLARLQPAVVASHGRFLHAPDPTVRLTSRQHQILQLMQGGLTAGAIASRLGISESTVGKHLRDLYARLDAHDRVSAIREARARGLLDGVGGEDWQDVLMP